MPWFIFVKYAQVFISEAQTSESDSIEKIAHFLIPAFFLKWQPIAKWSEKNMLALKNKRASHFTSKMS